MKLGRIISGSVVLALAANAYAFPGAVWFEAVPTSPNAGVEAQGPGQAALLTCDKLVAPCSWNLTLKYQTDGGAGGWALDLGTALAGEKINVSNVLVAANVLTSGTISQGTTPNAAGILAEGQGGASGAAAGAPAGTYDIATYTLTKGPGTNLGVYDILAAIGAVEFGGNDQDGYEIVAIGPNPGRLGYSLGGASAGGYESLPVITIRNVPEPSSLALIGLGALALIRRRS